MRGAPAVLIRGRGAYDVLAGRKTQHRLPASGETCRFKAGRTYGVFSRGGPKAERLCGVTVLDVRGEGLAEITDLDVRFEGHRSRLDFAHAWLGEHVRSYDPLYRQPPAVLEQLFLAASVRVWVLTFAVADEVRLPRAGMFAGATSDVRQAVHDRTLPRDRSGRVAPDLELVDAASQARFTAAARQAGALRRAQPWNPRIGEALDAIDAALPHVTGDDRRDLRTARARLLAISGRSDRHVA